MDQHKIGLLILRFALAGLFIWFGFNQLFNTSMWLNLVPDWATGLLPLSPKMIVLGNGLLEVVLGTLLALGFFIRPVSVLLSVHLFIIAFTFGVTPVAVRDMALAMATLSLAFLSNPKPAQEKMSRA